jgi:hypothetical protein
MSGIEAMYLRDPVVGNVRAGLTVGADTLPTWHVSVALDFPLTAALAG